MYETSAAAPPPCFAPTIPSSSLAGAKWPEFSFPGKKTLLALGVRFRTPVWSNDNDFQDLPIQWLTTEAILRLLGIIG